MKLTHEQHLAIYTHDKNLIVVAGAGSGKTRVLVERYLALLANNPTWPLNSLVAITFTRKAAQEMRDRVRQALQGPQWTRHLAQMDSARIDTIHGLCTSILRANAAEAGIDPGFVVLDETEARILLDDVIDALFQTFIGVGEADDDTAAVVRLFTHYGERIIREVLIEFALGEAADVDNVPTDVEAVLSGWLELWQREAVNEVHYLITHDGFVKAVDWGQAMALPPDDKLADIWAASWSPLERLRAFAGDLNHIPACVEALDLLRDLIKVNVGSAKNWGDKETLQIAKEALKAIRECAAEARQAIGEPPTDELHYHAAELLPLWAELIRRVRIAYQQVKAMQGALDFNDLELHTRDLLYNNPQSEAVRARYAVEFRHVLVDEFQDTNAAQWDIVRALASPDEPGRLFVVG
ncbi:MAG: UvrD-helicase domain-containing protein, partial [Burkholderiales bacterium]|nr:UvrD-helicase domain-containing protein [Anaerolineae bacterium]